VQGTERLTSTDLLVNLSIALSAALLGAVIAAFLGQSVILGYILGGVAIGPNTPGFVGDPVAVDALANVGIILLLFTIGIQISVADLRRVGRVAFLGAGIQVLLLIGIGYGIGIALGWDGLEAQFFGAVLSNSSSTVLSKVLGERGEADSVHGQIAFGWSTVQDLSTIVLVVVLSALAGDSEALLADLGWATLKALLFLTLLVPVGSRVLPWIFERVAALQNREVFLLTVAAIALGTAYAASLFGLSLALGAFVAGVVVSESDLSHQIIGEIAPLRDIFTALFFISVGMLVDPGFVLRNLPLVLLTVALIVLVKGVIIAGLALSLRCPLRTALLVGVTLSQSAEFSFLLARLGADLDAVSPAVFSLMLSGAAVSIVLAPGLRRAAEPAIRGIEVRMPPSALTRMPQTNAQALPRGHVVLCGYGRVGQVIGSAVRRRGFPMIVVEQDQRIVRRLRDQGVQALLGYGEQPEMLDRAHLETARLLVIAIPDALAARRIVDYVRERYPRLEIVVRTHSLSEQQVLHERGANEAVVGELELAVEMTRYTLRRFGVSGFEVQAILQRLRHQSERDGQRPLRE
jgi:CPA2 family monovalent cation:H+ antiporter-2